MLGLVSGTVDKSVFVQMKLKHLGLQILIQKNFEVTF